MGSDIEKLLSLLKSSKIKVAQLAPAVRVSLGEEFDIPVGTEVTGKIITALKMIGFDYVFDTSFGADIVALEEAYELSERLSKQGPFPLLTSCCIGWKMFAYNKFPEKMCRLSTCMAPQITLGALSKTYFAEQANVDPKEIVTISIMPCISKKKEAQMEAEVGVDEVNLVLTTREISQVFKDFNIQFNELESQPFDKYLGEASVSGAKFGTTGGVAEAVINCMYRMNGDDSTIVQIEDDSPLQEYSFNIKGQQINVIRVYGLPIAVEVMNSLDDAGVREGKQIHLVEVMACPYGCVGGPGQPLPFSMDKNKARSHALRKYANSKKYKDPVSNPEANLVYEKFLTKVGSTKAKELLHIGCSICKLFKKE